MKIFLKATEKLWNTFFEPGLKTANPNISAGVAAKAEKPQSAQITSTVLKLLTGGKVLFSTDKDGNGLRLRVL